MKLILLALLYLVPLSAESRGHKLLKWSWVALVAGNAADAASSWGRFELNPVLGPRFGARSAGIKFGLVGAVIGAEYLLTRRHAELQKPFTVGNFAVSGVFFGVAARNYFHTGM